MAYGSEAAKVRDMPNVMRYITGTVVDVGCGHDKLTPDAFGVDGRQLPGVDYVTSDVYNLSLPLTLFGAPFDTVFSSHFLEHLQDPFKAIEDWAGLLKPGGHLILYLPDGRKYDNGNNFEHMYDWTCDSFIFWMRRSFCGDGKDFKGENLPKLFELVEFGEDFGEDRYSFYVICKKL